MSGKSKARTEGDKQAALDLKKPVLQLLKDIHEQAFKCHTPENWVAHILDAQRRIASMHARLARSNEKLGWFMLALTITIAVMTGVLVWLTYRLTTA